MDVHALRQGGKKRIHGMLEVFPLSAKDKKKEADRLENCGTVLKEILDIPDDIPQDLLDKAECAIIYPSVLKAAFILGASYGRGAMACRTGEHFTGPWGAPRLVGGFLLLAGK